MSLSKNEYKEVEKLENLVPSKFHKQLQSSESKFRNHPLKTILDSPDQERISKRKQDYIVCTLDSIFEAKKSIHEKWFQQKWEDDVLSLENEFNSSIGALAEFRAFNQLKNLQVKLITDEANNDSERSGDFQGELDSGEHFRVEVYAPRIKDEAGNKRKNMYEKAGQEKPGDKTLSIFSCRYDPVAEGVAGVTPRIRKIRQRIVGNKEKGKQASSKEFSILWVDLMPAEWNLKIDTTLPYISKRFKGNYITGNYGIWLSFYGKKDMKIFDQRVWLKFAEKREFMNLEQNGWFRENFPWSAVIIAYIGGTVIFQNPWAEKKLNKEILGELVRLNDFNPYYSWISPDNEKLKERIKQKVDEFEELYKIVVE